MSRALRLTAAAALVAAAFTAVPASAEFPPDCEVTMEEQRFAGPGGGTWYLSYPTGVVCTL